MGLVPGTAQAAEPGVPAEPAKGAAAQDTAGNPNLELALSADITTARGIDLNINIASADAALDVTIDWGDGTTAKATASGSDVLRHNLHTYARPGEYNVTVTVADRTNGVQVVKQLPFATAGSFFVPHAPTRLLDTRDGTGAARAKAGAFSTTRVKMAGNAKVPAGVAAVVLNVTVTNTTAPGHVTAYPSGTARPESSNLNYTAGQTVPNMVIVPVGKDGYVELYNHGGNGVDLIADVTGYFDRKASDGYTSMNPVRFVDTREGLGTVQGQVPGSGTFGVPIRGRSGIPAGATAVALNVTVTNPRAAGHLTVFPGGQAASTTSNLNFAAGQTVANSVIVPIGADGRIDVRNGSWAGTDVIVDVVGYYSPDSKAAFTSTRPGTPSSPWRLLDSRRWTGWPCLAGGYMPTTVGAYPVDSRPPIEAYVLNVTVTSTSGPGHLSIAPDPYSMDAYRNGRPTPPPRPTTSTLNWTAGQDVPNLVQARPGPYDVIDFWNQSTREVHYVVDWFGQYDAY
ncbi:PKD domain-containing protein [Streptomyces sp. ISL-94]|uniref:PKD domain-containing protein n=1 Tax=Streptomyces sp. ISL-94 TaxID=2819190 RepID=UPI001BEA1310|nr:PKD domain-containing protein [Streptomyces sp. ISL-94]MBT2479701.1 PKD domain-containing protein [Streptomyces sp. ISL-94]